ncbi:MAG: VIT1/CCC1 transporter family protein [Candidatus Micrarchaeota archaeon]|nr:VIT1/CCC1 transporter family protein [Candidatus Micrarchaeota archaeon]
MDPKPDGERLSKLAGLIEKGMSRSRASKLATRELEEHAQRSPSGSLLRQVILGGQDGVVNVLGLVLGVASATNDARLILISGLAGTFAESISMAAVAYTSARATQDNYVSEREREKWEMENAPDIEREEVRLIYMKKGFQGRTLDGIVKKITSDKKTWLDAMLTDELGLGEEAKRANPVREAAVVGFASLGGSFIPILPFFFLPVWEGMLAALALATAVLFGAGYKKAQLTIGKPWKSGTEMAFVGIAAAIAGYAIGALLGKI